MGFYRSFQFHGFYKMMVRNFFLKNITYNVRPGEPVVAHNCYGRDAGTHDKN